MGRIILVTGGTRSGKSRFAESLCLSLTEPRFYIATCPRIEGDSDLALRIEAHQAVRAGCGWITLEEPLDLERSLNQALQRQGNALLECLGLWINNLVFQGIEDRREAEETLQKRIAKICGQWRQGVGTLVVVGQEAGLGMVPCERESRLWLDLLGCARNAFAAEADEVFLVASGLPLRLKPINEPRNS